MEAQSLGDLGSLFNADSRPLRSTPVVGQAFIDTPGKGAYGFFKRSVVVRAVSKHHVNVVELHALERVSETLNDVLPAQERVVGPKAATENLRRDHQVGSLSVQRLQGVSQLDLSGAKFVNLCSIVEVDTSIKALLD